MTPKSRLDVLLVQRGLAESREKAQAFVMSGAVLVDGKPASKPGVLVSDGAELELLGSPRYVGRGGEKLEHALRVFALDVRGLVAVDAGASTGGFTDCLLQHGAARVCAVDVGYGLLDPRLRADPRVRVMERVNVRYLEALPEAPDIAAVDVSFISLQKVVPPLMKLLKGGGHVLALIKPQFEARREEVGKRGVVRDPQVHAAVIGRTAAWAASQGLRLCGLTTSPLRGPAGNKEFFVLWRKETGAQRP